MKPSSILSLAGTFFRKKPVYIHYGVTHRCNLACRMCSIKSAGDGVVELPIDDIDFLFGVLKNSGAVYVSLGGGEPLVRPDIDQIAGLLIKKGFIVRLLTNGALCSEERLERFRDIGLDHLSVSLDTLDTERQDFICASPGAGKAALKCIDAAGRILDRKRGLLLVNTVISALNIDILPALCEFARKKGFYISFMPYEGDACLDFSLSGSGRSGIDAVFNALLSIKRSRNNNIFNSVYFLEKVREYLKTGKRDWICDAGVLYYSVDPGGGVSVCHKFAPFVTVDELKKRKEKVLAGPVFNIRGCGECLRPCWAETSFFFNYPGCALDMARLKLRDPFG